MCSIFCPEGHSHFGGAAYIGLWKLPLSATLSRNDPIFLFKIDGSHSTTIYFSFDQSPKTSIFFNFYRRLVISNNSVHNIPFLKLVIQYKLLLWDWNGSIILDQNAVSHPMTPFQFFSKPIPLGAKTGALYLFQFYAWVHPGYFVSGDLLMLVHSSIWFFKRLSRYTRFIEVS